MFYKIFLVAALSLSSAFVSADDITPQCKTALTNVIASPDAACLDGSALLSLVIQGNNASIIDPINTWLTGLCAQPQCSNDTLAAVVKNVTDGCPDEFSSLGISGSSTADITAQVQAAYPPIRQAICLKDTTTNTLCVTETLTNIQNLAGTLSADNIANVIANLKGMTSFPANITCTDCIKQMYNIFKNQFPTEVSGLADPLQSQCGASFLDGATPSDVAEIAKTGTSHSGAALAAMSLLSPGTFTGIALSLLLAVSSAVALLA
jgi:hypothetical protein